MIPIERVRAYWAQRHGLGGAMKGATPEAALARSGWARSVGGCNPYVALRDRAGISREDADRAVKALAIHELPAVRGCTYVVPREDFALALRAGQADDAEMASAKKHLGVTEKEIAKLCESVVRAVSKEPLDPAALKETLGDAVRSLGAEGKKRGVATTLPLALGQLQARGRVRRVPVDGRLDQQRYRYVAWELAVPGMSDAEMGAELARRFFRWAGPATIAQLAWWAGLGMKAARAAAAEAKAVAIDEGDDRLMLKEDRDELLGMEMPREARVSFVTSLDNVLHMRRDAGAQVDDARALEGLPGGGAGASLKELPVHPILDRGRIIGVWDWDGLEGELVWRTFAKGDGRAVKDAASRFARYVREELGDARSFSLDSPESRAKRIEALRA